MCFCYGKKRKRKILNIIINWMKNEVVLATEQWLTLNIRTEGREQRGLSALPALLWMQTCFSHPLNPAHITERQ